MEIKSVTNNDVADVTEDQKLLALRKRDREIMSKVIEKEEHQIVSLGKKGPLWVGDPVTHPVKDTLWDFQACDLPYLWTYYGVRGDDVNVFVLDSGMDTYHPVFAHHKENVVAKSFVSSLPSPLDGCGHGTWVCGKIAGNGIGIAPSCNIKSLRVLDDSGTGRSDFITKALEWILAQDDFPHVINMSLGGPRRNTKHEKLLWQLYRKGAMIIVASGNDGDDYKFYPAAYDGVLAVGAVNKQKTKAVFSNYGAHIAVCAPGVACYSAYPAGGFRLLQGTSMAAPTVAGLVSLGISYALRCGMTGGEKLRDLVTTCLETSAEDLGELGRDPYYGFGCIDGHGFLKKLEGSLK